MAHHPQKLSAHHRTGSRNALLHRDRGNPVAGEPGGRLGVAFRRQVPIGRYVADFAALSVKLVVEVDGGYHSLRREADARRDRDLARWGYRVVRVGAEEVRADVRAVVALVREVIAQG
ncbi:MAG: DUF559 domain-containing protein, partial [Myxococcales bacterium]|nr:DUF559 domain-containing protein [Myxococcales bacterium]